MSDSDTAEQARDEAEDARDEAEEARDEATDARDDAEAAEERVADSVDRLADRDPALDTAARRYEAHADEENPFGRPGRRMRTWSPFRVGFVGALGVFTAYVLAKAVSSARQVLILIVVALFLAVGLNPAVEWLARRGLGRKGGVGVVFAGVLLFFVGFGAAVVPPIANQATQFVQQVPDYLDQLQGNPTVRRLDNQYGFIAPLRGYAERQVKGGQGLQLFGGVIGFGKVVLGAFFSVLVVLVLTLYFMASLPSIKQAAYRLAPRSRRARVGLLADEILARVGGYVAGALSIAGIAGLSSLVVLEALGVPYAIALAMLVAVTDLIPLIGATVGAVIVTGVAFFDSVTSGIVVGVFYVAYQQVENYLIYPRVMKRSVDVAPAVTVVAALIGGALLGVVGALLAIPTAAAIQLIVREVVEPRQDTS